MVDMITVTIPRPQDYCCDAASNTFTVWFPYLGDEAKKTDAEFCKAMSPITPYMYLGAEAEQ